MLYNDETSTAKPFKLWRSRQNGTELDAYRRIALQLHYDLPRHSSARSVMIASPMDAAVAAECSLKVAWCLAEELGTQVLLVDASAVSSEVSKLLNCAGGPGIAELLSGSHGSLKDVAHATTQENVWFLSAGTFGNGSRSASPEKVAAFLLEAQRSYDFVVLCGGALLQNSLALAIAPHAGVVLLSVVEDVTSVNHVDSARRSLAMCKAQKIGTVLVTSEDRG